MKLTNVKNSSNESARDSVAEKSSDRGLPLAIKWTEFVLKKTHRASEQDGAFRRLVEGISAIPECCRSELFRLSLTDRNHPDVTTCHILKTIRKALEALVPTEELPRLVPEVCELDDTRNNVEVAFAIDRILRRSRTEGAD